MRFLADLFTQNRWDQLDFSTAHFPLAHLLLCDSVRWVAMPFLCCALGKRHTYYDFIS